MFAARCAATLLATFFALSCKTPGGRGAAAVKDDGGGFNPVGENAPNGSACGFYTHLENVAQCGPNGYPTGYGLKYCQKFGGKCGGKLTSGLANLWIEGTMFCLQDGLRNFYQAGAKTCADVDKYAFDSHPFCYTNGYGGARKFSICLLTPIEMTNVFRCVDTGDLFTTKSAKQASITAATCGYTYAKLVAGEAVAVGKEIGHKTVQGAVVVGTATKKAAVYVKDKSGATVTSAKNLVASGWNKLRGNKLTGDSCPAGAVEIEPTWDLDGFAADEPIPSIDSLIADAPELRQLGQGETAFALTDGMSREEQLTRAEEWFLMSEELTKLAAENPCTDDGSGQFLPQDAPVPVPEEPVAEGLPAPTEGPAPEGLPIPEDQPQPDLGQPESP